VIHIPLERLLERLADQVGSAKLDPEAGPYERAQMQAAAEILRNLAPRVRWDIDENEAQAALALLRSDDNPVTRKAIEELAGRQLERELGNLRR
jgi:hypothetical protein